MTADGGTAIERNRPSLLTVTNRFRTKVCKGAPETETSWPSETKRTT
jgi:hypothetical protein